MCDFCPNLFIKAFYNPYAENRNKKRVKEKNYKQPFAGVLESSKKAYVFNKLSAYKLTKNIIILEIFRNFRLAAREITEVA